MKKIITKIPCFFGIHDVAYFYNGNQTLIISCEWCDYEKEEWFVGMTEKASQRSRRYKTKIW